MQHVDDGTLQAWLDAGRAGLSATERGEIERHLAACAACARRAQAAEALDGRARSLLSPPDVGDGAIPPFEAVVARARRARAAGRAGGGRDRVRAALPWAATIALALGAGWWASELSHGGRADPTDVTAAAAHAPPAESRTHLAQPPAADRPKAAQSRVQVAEAPTRTVERARAPLPRVQVAEAPARLADVVSATEPSAAGERPRERPAAPPAAGEVRGRVTDESGRPLPSAQVVLEGTRSGALTRADGTFSLPLAALPVDSFTRTVTVTAHLLGYTPASRSLAISSAGDAVTELRLAPQAVALNAIVVTGAPAAAAWAPATRADAERRAGFKLLTVPDLALVRIELRETPGGIGVRVAQRLAGGGLLELVESREALLREQPSLGAGGASASTQRGDVYVLAAAPVDGEALIALLGRLR